MPDNLEPFEVEPGQIARRKNQPKEKKNFKSGFDRVRGVYWTSSDAEDINELDPKKDVESVKKRIEDKILKKEGEYIEAVFDTYLPRKPAPLTGYCIDYFELDKKIKVALDIYIFTGLEDLSRNPEIIADWGRPKLSRADIIRRHVKLYVQKEKNRDTGVEEVRGVAIAAIAPPNQVLW